MIKTTALAVIVFAVAVLFTGFVGSAHGQTTTTSPTVTNTTTPTPTGSVQGASTVPSGAPSTGHGGY